MKKMVFVGMSGGVDSSVAAYLLKKKGYEVVGIFMRCWHPNSALPAKGLQQSESAHPNNYECPTERDAEDARRVAEHLEIPFYVWDFEEEYKREVVDYMIDGYRRGLTPNPDVMCNRQIKFGLFYEKARAAGADFVATGHYVCLRRLRDPNLRTHPNDPKKLRDIRVNSDSLDRHILLQAKDKNKDQSYFLWTLQQEQLRHCLFPIGDYLKPEVREIARRAGIPTADKKDSQGVCFLGKFSVADFLKQRIKSKPGVVKTTSGEKIGMHDGAWFYTIGQRHGVVANRKSQIANRNGGSNYKPLYVAEKDAKTNTITVAEGEDHPALYKKEVELRSVNFVSIQYSHILKNVRILVWARVRYRQPLTKAVLVAGSVCDAVSGRKQLQQAKRHATRSDQVFKLVFDKPAKFVAEGQSVVFYDKKGRMLGGGVISGAK